MELLTEVGRARYLLQQGSLRTVLSVMNALWHRAFAVDSIWSRDAGLAVNRRLEAMFARDFENTRKGYYPRDLLAFPLLDYLPLFPEAISDAPRMWWKRLRSEHQHRAADPHLPNYYRRRFHWQPDGWLSDHSARVYDIEVEFLFLGAADVMRRMAIPPIVDALRGHERPRVLDIACGTARMLRHLSVAIPHARLYGVDLSPHYIAKAREDVPDATFLVENAEHMPLADASFDAAVSVFLFHELPRDARMNVLREAHRVLAPGGTFVVCDSLQRRDDPDGEMEFFFEFFPRTYHEPYFKAWIEASLVDDLQAAGFEVVEQEPHAMNTVTVARKPA